MDWEKIMEHRLRQYPYKEKAIENIQNRIEFLDSNMYGLKSVMRDTEPVQGGGNKQEDVLLDRIVEKTLLESNIELCKYEIMEIDKALGVLEGEERQVIELFYLQLHRISVEKIIDKLHLSKSHLYRIRDKSLKKLTMYLYGKTEI